MADMVLMCVVAAGLWWFDGGMSRVEVGRVVRGLVGLGRGTRDFSCARLWLVRNRRASRRRDMSEMRSISLRFPLSRIQKELPHWIWVDCGNCVYRFVKGAKP